MHNQYSTCNQVRVRWSWNCVQTKFSLCTNFILQKLLTQMVNNSSLTAWGDGAHLNFINCSNLCNAHKLKKKKALSHCTIDGVKVCLKGQRYAAGLVCTVSWMPKEYSEAIYLKIIVYGLLNILPSLLAV